MSVGYPDWGGQRLLHGTNQLFAASLPTITPGTTSVKTVMVNRPGYIVELHMFNATNNTSKCPFNVNVRWLDAQSSDNLDTQSWYGLAGTSVGPHYIDGAGPSKGGTLQVSISNQAGAGVNLGGFMIIDETSFAYTRHDWRTDDVFSFAPTGYTAPNSDSNAGILGVISGSTVLANSQATWVLPLYDGPIWVQGGNSGAAGSMEISVTPEAAPSSMRGGPTFDMFNDANGNIFAKGNMTRAQSLLTVVNHTAANFAAFWTVSAEER